MTRRTMLYLLADAPRGDPAGGAALEEVAMATLVGIVLVALLAAFGAAHRAERTQLLTRLAAFAERVSNIPRWAALPAAVAGGSLAIAAFGFYADVASHIDEGRDPGPFANPYHYLIIVGLLGIGLAGYLSVLIGAGEDDPARVRVRPGWSAPAAGVLMLLCGAIAVLGFPLDDTWHRLFGQDVTLWSPTHVQMVGGASLSTLALWALLSEAGQHGHGDGSLLHRLRGPFVAGAFLIGLSAMHAEFDYGVPQFRLLYQPVLLVLSAAVALVPARICLGRGGALKTVVVFLGIRGLLTLAIGPVLGHTLLHFPLYLVEALVVEAVAARLPRERQLTLGAWAGAGIGTVGLATEWLWSHVWMPLPWPAALLPEAAVPSSPGFRVGCWGGISRVHSVLGISPCRWGPAGWVSRPPPACSSLSHTPSPPTHASARRRRSG
ncbi:MAG: hypothetical protein ABR575_04330 [Actinomycetota bacterium]